MRITTSQMFTNAMLYVNENRDKYLQLQEQLATQKKVNRPSDDPIAATRASGVKTIISRFEQYQRNVNSARSFVDTMETALAHVSDDLSRAREVAVDINGGNAGPADFQAAAQEVQRLFEDVLQNANSKDDQRFVFAGYSTTSAPFDNAGNYLGGVNQDINIEISDNNYLAINKDGNEIFKAPSDVFGVLHDLEAAINSGDQTAITAMMPRVEAALNQVINNRADLGSMTARLDAASDDNDQLVQAYTKILSDTEDIDVAKVTSDFAFQQQVYQTTLSVASKVMSQSLLDFLK